MKPFTHRLFALLMAAIVLVSSTGFGLVEHSCVVRGKSVHLGYNKDKPCKGCPTSQKQNPANQTGVKKANCCKDEQKYENVDVSSSVTQMATKVVKSVADAVVGACVAIVREIVEAIVKKDSDSSVVSFSSLHYGRSLLAFVQSFLN